MNKLLNKILKFRKEKIGPKNGKYLNKKFKYDLIIGIGQNCLTSEILKESCLKEHSTPFDWVQIYGYEASINILKNKFENHLQKEDLEFKGVDIFNASDIYYNKKTKIAYIHNFGSWAHENFDRAYEKVNVKLQRRIERILNKIANSKKVCLLYIEYAGLIDANAAINNEIIHKDIEDLEKLYKTEFDIFYIKHNPNLELNEYIINDKICEVNNSMIKNGKYGYRGNKPTVKYIVTHRIDLNTYKKLINLINNFVRILKKLFLIVKILYT